MGVLKYLQPLYFLINTVRVKVNFVAMLIKNTNKLALKVIDIELLKKYAIDLA